MDFKREIFAYKHYFLCFYNEQSEGVQRKIEWTLKLISITPRVPEKYFKHLTAVEGIYEIRVEFEGNIYRIFAFFDRGNVVVLGNGLVKKSQKLSTTDIDKALKIRKEYFDEKAAG